ncbi:MAG: ABC transporter substrate-binding protein, partial [Actinomycetota bacterium]
VQIAVDEYNGSRDSIFQARLERGDTGGTPEGAAAVAGAAASTERLIGVVGPLRIEQAAAAAPMLGEAGIPTLIPSVTEVSLGSAGWTSYRRLVADDRRQGMALGAEAARRARRGLIGAKAAIVHDESPSGASFAEGAREALQDARVEVARFEAARGNVDYRALGAAITRDPPGAVLHGGSGERAGALLAGLRAAGFQGSFLASREAHDSRFMDWAGGAGAGAETVCACADPGDPSLREFAGAHLRRFSAPPAPYAVEAYEGTLMLLEAIQEVEARPREVAGFFRSAPVFLGMSKSYSFDDGGEVASAPVWLYRFKEGVWRWAGRST